MTVSRVFSRFFPGIRNGGLPKYNSVNFSRCIYATPVKYDRAPGQNLMKFDPIVWPSLFYSVRNWLVTTFIIKPYLDPKFNIQEFIDGSKQAVEVISKSLSESDFDYLLELVDPEAFKILRDVVQSMSVAEREDLNIRKEDIYLCFPYQIGLIFDEDNRRWVEITMCYHILKGLKEMKERDEDVVIGFSPEYRSKLHICNYRFIREYTKEIKNSNWLVNIVNHFKESDFMKQ